MQPNAALVNGVGTGWTVSPGATGRPMRVGGGPHPRDDTGGPATQACRVGQSPGVRVCNAEITVRLVPVVGGYAHCSRCFGDLGLPFPGRVRPYDPAETLESGG